MQLQNLQEHGMKIVKIILSEEPRPSKDKGPMLLFLCGSLDLNV